MRSRKKASTYGKATRVRIAEWLLAKRWRHRVEEALGESGLTFAQCFVLSAIDELITDTDQHDAVSQNQVSERLEQDRSTTSQIMSTLAKKQLIDRGGAMTGPAWRVTLTALGHAVVEARRAAVEKASAAE